MIDNYKYYDMMILSRKENDMLKWFIIALVIFSIWKIIEYLYFEDEYYEEDVSEWFVTIIKDTEDGVIIDGEPLPENMEEMFIKEQTEEEIDGVTRLTIKWIYRDELRNIYDRIRDEL